MVGALESMRAFGRPAIGALVGAAMLAASAPASAAPGTTTCDGNAIDGSLSCAANSPAP